MPRSAACFVEPFELDNPFFFGDTPRRFRAAERATTAWDALGGLDATVHPIGGRCTFDRRRLAGDGWKIARLDLGVTWHQGGRDLFARVPHAAPGLASAS